MSFEKKNKFAFWAYPQTMKDVEQHFRGDNCKSQSEFIEKAVRFYIGYLDEERHVNYLSPLITETVAATIKGSEQHITRILFKPKCMDEMFRIAEQLSQGISFVRVDLYQSSGQIYFGELTFFPDSGFDSNLLPETDNYFGSLTNISESRK